MKTKSAPIVEDLSTEIAAAVEQRPDEHVRVIRLFADCYRCNWWVEDSAQHPFWIRTGTIRKSRFVHAEKSNGRLRITDAPRPREPE